MSQDAASAKSAYLRVAYADPPYPGMAHFYRDHPDYGGEIPPEDVCARLAEYDAWVLHTASVTLADVLRHCPKGTRVGAWVKPFAVYKPGVNPAYAWEPVLFYGGRNDSSKENPTLTDWISCPITLRKGLVGAKPPKVIEWAFRMLGLDGSEELHDLYPGTGIVGQTWDSWRRQPTLLAVHG